MIGMLTAAQLAVIEQSEELTRQKIGLGARSADV
jgi:hypothetical protein